MVKKRKKLRPSKPRPCRFCLNGVEYIDYKSLPAIKPYLNERAKIKARRTTGTCAQHQAQLARAIKNAREMALIPYTTR